MQAVDQPFTKMVGGASQFVIPVFQRDYSWTETQCSQLWKDILRTGSDPAAKGHFLGSVVYVSASDTRKACPRWLLIDGQQRVTTLTLLAIALRQHILDTGWSSEDEDAPTPEQIEGYFLRNLLEKGDRRHKLMLRRRDQQALAALLDGEPPAEDIASSRIFENFEFFRDRVAEADPDVVYKGINRLVVVDVTLDASQDDPQMVFESLNSTGLDLAQADLIRNYILMRLPEPEQTRLYETYWSKIEALFRDAGKTFDAFARDYMALHRRAAKQSRADEIYQDFREFFREERGLEDLDEALSEMLRFARYHAAFSLRRGGPPALATALSRLRSLAETAAILAMRLSDCHQRLGTLSDSEFIEALTLLESYVFRRSVCGMQTRGYWQVFANMAYRVKDEEPLTSLKVALRRQRESYRFPRDDEFRRELEGRDLYALRTCHYLLDRFENHASKEPTNTSNYTVEHILPQNENLPKAWREMLGASWREIQEIWLHRLGNLTLTGYNSTYSDRPFDEKKTIPGGFEESSVRLNKFVRGQSEWTEKEIRRRGRQLGKRGLEIWPALEVSEEAVKAAIKEQLIEKASLRDVSEVQMTREARDLLEVLRPEVKSLDGGVIEMAEKRSVSYHAADFFMEVLPRKRRILLLLNLDFNECDDPAGIAGDAQDYKFFFYAKHAGGVYCPLTEPEGLPEVMHLVRQAHQLARD